MLRTSLLALFALSFAGCGGDAPAGGGGGGGDDRPRVVVIPKGTTHVFWQAVRAGAEQAGEVHGLDVVFKGPMAEGDREGQIQLVQQFVGEGVAGIALAPLDHKALVPSVRRATQQGIPVVIFDSALEGTAGKDYASFVATDNEQGGVMAGEELARLLKDKREAGTAKVVMLRYQSGSASTEARERGFLKAMKEAGIEVLVDNRYAGATIGDAKTTALNLADQLRQADGVFCSNESVTVGMLRALEQLALTGKLRVVGFDSSAPIVAALAAGQLDATVVQDPLRMGEIAVEHLRALIDGGDVPLKVDTGAVLATKANMEQPAVARLLR